MSFDLSTIATFFARARARSGDVTAERPAHPGVSRLLLDHRDDGVDAHSKRLRLQLDDLHPEFTVRQARPEDAPVLGVVF